MNKKPKKIVWASAVAVDALDPYVRELLEHIAEITEQPGVAGAMVSDESWISDFMPSYFDEERKQAYRERVAAQTDPARKERGERMLAFMEKPRPGRGVVEERLKALGVKLGIEIAPGDCVYEVAIRLRDK